MKPVQTKVAILFGGQSAEHSVSVNSGAIAIQNLSQHFHVFPVYLQKDGVWRFPRLDADLTDPSTIARDLIAGGGEAFDTGHGLSRLQEHGATVAFLALHGPFGEDGRLQGMLELAGIPYTGSNVLGSAIAMDKDIAKRLYAHGGLNVAASRTLRSNELKQGGKASSQAIVSELGLPLVVKPVAQGSSVGTSICRDIESLGALLQSALEHGGAALIEQFVAGREMTCGVLELSETERCALPPTLIRPKTADFFDYKAKYQAGETEEITPAPVEPELLLRVQKAALQAHELLQLRAYSRSDFIERDGELFILESNTLPGLTATSLFPQAAQVAGIPLDLLLCHLVCLAQGNPSPIRGRELKYCYFPAEE